MVVVVAVVLARVGQSGGGDCGRGLAVAAVMCACGTAGAVCGCGGGGGEVCSCNGGSGRWCSGLRQWWQLLWLWPCHVMVVWWWWQLAGCVVLAVVLVLVRGVAGVCSCGCGGWGVQAVPLWHCPLPRLLLPLPPTCHHCCQDCCSRTQQPPATHSTGHMGVQLQGCAVGSSGGVVLGRGVGGHWPMQAHSLHPP